MRVYGNKQQICKPRTKGCNAMHPEISSPHPQANIVWSSYKERRVDALALRADERRDKLRKASGRSKYPVIRRYLNGETYLRRPQVSTAQSISCGREPGELKHLSSRRKRKQHVILEVAASETGRAQTGVRALRGSDRGIDPKDLTERPGKAGQRG